MRDGVVIFLVMGYVLTPACLAMTKLYVGVLWNEEDLGGNMAEYESELDEVAHQYQQDHYIILPLYLPLQTMDTNAIHGALCDSGVENLVAYTIISCNISENITSDLGSVPIPYIISEPVCLQTDADTQVAKYRNFTRDIGSVVEDIARSSAWWNYYLFYDDSYSSVMDSVVGAARIPAVVFHIPANVTSEQVDVHLLHIHSTSTRPEHILLACDVTAVNTILDTANDFGEAQSAQGALVFEDDWLIVAKEDDLGEQIISHVGDIDNLALVNPVLDTEDAILRVLWDDFSSLLSIIYGLIIDEKENVTSLGFTESTKVLESDCYSGQIIPGLAQALEPGPGEKSESNVETVYTVQTAWRHQEGRAFSIVLVYDQSLTPSKSSVFPNKEFALNGRHWIVATNIWPPFVEVVRSNNSEYAGLCMSLLEEISNSLNFTYELVLPHDMGWGVLSGGGQWTGLVGMLQNKTVSLAVAPLGVTAQREHYIDFTDAYFSEYVTALVKLEDPDAWRWRLYILPFSWEVWVCLIVTTPLAGLTIWLVTKLSPYYGGPSYFSHLDLSLVYAVSSALTQGGEYLPESPSVRFVVGFWWMFVIVIVAIYTGNLIAFLTFSEDILPFYTFEEMLHTGRYTYGTMGETNFITLFNMTSVDLYSDIWDQMLKFAETDPTVLSPVYDVHVQKVFEENYAYIADKTSFEMALSTFCDVDMIHDEILPYTYALALQNSSAYTQLFSRTINSLIETGILSYWKQQWWPKQSFCARGMVTEAEPVTLHDVQGVYYALAVLLTLSTITVVVEVILGKISRCTQRRKAAKQTENVEIDAAEVRDTGHSSENGNGLIYDTLGGDIHQRSTDNLLGFSDTCDICRTRDSSSEGPAQVTLGFEVSPVTRRRSNLMINPVFGLDLGENDDSDAQDQIPMNFVYNIPEEFAPDKIIADTKPR